MRTTGIFRLYSLLTSSVVTPTSATLLAISGGGVRRCQNQHPEQLCTALSSPTTRSESGNSTGGGKLYHSQPQYRCALTIRNSTSMTMMCTNKKQPGRRQWG